MRWYKLQYNELQYLRSGAKVIVDNKQTGKITKVAFWAHMIWIQNDNGTLETIYKADIANNQIELAVDADWWEKQ